MQQVGAPGPASDTMQSPPVDREMREVLWQQGSWEQNRWVTICADPEVRQTWDDTPLPLKASRGRLLYIPESSSTFPQSENHPRKHRLRSNETEVQDRDCPMSFCLAPLPRV